MGGGRDKDERSRAPAKWRMSSPDGDQMGPEDEQDDGTRVEMDRSVAVEKSNAEEAKGSPGRAEDEKEEDGREDTEKNQHRR